MRRAAFAAFAVFALAGCELSQGVQYSDGKYAGKPDTRAWESEQFGGDRAQWEREIKARSLKQSEYTRMKGGG